MASSTFAMVMANLVVHSSIRVHPAPISLRPPSTRMCRVRMASPAPPNEPRPDEDEDFDSTPRIGGASARQQPDVPPQLARSRALVNEGLEGFPRRAAELLYLGSTFWLGWPALIVFSLSLAASVGLYASLGDRFVHGGTPAGRRMMLPVNEASHVPLGWRPDDGDDLTALRDE